MREWRSGSLVRGAAFLLLLWTALDLTNSGLCALDQERRMPVETIASVTTIEPAEDPAAPASSSRVHVDDCFCCSHCVEASAIVVPWRTTQVGLRQSTAPQRAPRRTPQTIFHPPQILA